MTKKMSLQNISHRRKTSAQEILMGGEPMRMRLRSPFKFDKDRNRLPDLDSKGNVVSIIKKILRPF